MSLLDSEATAGVMAALDGSVVEPVSVETPAPEVEAAPEEAASSEPAQDVNDNAGVEAQTDTEPVQEATAETSQEASADTDGEAGDEETPGHRVPYNRFKQVVDARNGYKEQLSALEQKVASLSEELKLAQQIKQMLPAQQAPQASEDKWLDGLLEGSSPQQPEQPAQDPRVDALMERLHAQEVALAQRQLEGEISEAVGKYPNADRQFLLQAVASDPGVSIMNVAEAYSARIAEIEEAAIARHLKDNPAPVAKKPEAPPRPAKSGASESTVGTGEKKPKSVAEGSAFLRDAWGKLNPLL